MEIDPQKLINAAVGFGRNTLDWNDREVAAKHQMAVYAAEDRQEAIGLPRQPVLPDFVALSLAQIVHDEAYSKGLGPRE